MYLMALHRTNVVEVADKDTMHEDLYRLKGVPTRGVLQIPTKIWFHPYVVHTNINIIAQKQGTLIVCIE